MDNDPLSITLSLIISTNLLEDNKSYNINEIKSLPNIERHWKTIKKYYKIFHLVQKYCPNINMIDSKIRVIKSEIYSRLNLKEKAVLFLFNKKALNEESATILPDRFKEKINDSLDYIFKKTRNNNYYLTNVGIDIYKSIYQDFSDLIFNNKDINEVYPIEEFNDDTSQSISMLKKFKSSLQLDFTNSQSIGFTRAFALDPNTIESRIKKEYHTEYI